MATVTAYTQEQLCANDEGCRFHSHWFTVRREIMKWLVGPDILEVGCGSGLGLAIMAPFFSREWKFSGYDPALTTANWDWYMEARRAVHSLTSQSLGLRPIYNTVFTSHVLEHVEELPAILNQCRDLTTRRTIHVVPDGNVDDKNLGTPHLHTFNRQTFRKLFSTEPVAYYPIYDPHMNSLIIVHDHE